ncbi:outer membrane beta-barrel protein [Chitinophaga sp. ARDCPP14]|uniref:outer membrane beta-barrel protein n=1 Tax=Chitinophaga sp. ARDCPP14 TaxID=3391139 RepID=UPI003F51FE10
MKQLIMLLLIVVSTSHSSAQKSHQLVIKGRITDKETQDNLSSATITFLYAKDSSKAGLSFTNKEGFFIIDSLTPTNFILLVSFIGYEKLLYPLHASSTDTLINIGTIGIKRTGLTLTEVKIVETRIPLRIARDTMEYNANYFETRDNALVEDLFRLLPGVQIDKDGTISVNGEPVKSIMINGRPIFSGGDNRIISKNLQADLIDRVQLIDRKTNRQDFNGSSSNQPDKVINLTIKKSKQNLISGEISGAYGTANRFSTKLSLSRFKGEEQLLLLGNGDNTNGAIETKTTSVGGIQENWNGAGNYSNRINKNTTISANYIANNNISETQRNSARKNIISDTSLLIQQKSSSNNKDRNQALTTQIEYQIDSLQNITISNQLTLFKTDNNFANRFNSLGNYAQVLGNGTFKTMDENNTITAFTGLNYEKKFNKNRRLLNISISYSKSVSKQIGYNISNTLYYPNSRETISDTLDQRSIINTQNEQLFVMATYTEPIHNYGAISFMIGEDRVKGSLNKTILDYNNMTKLYDKANDSLSNIFVTVPIHHYAKLNWLVKKEKFDYSVSLAALYFSMENKDNSVSNIYSTNVLALLPEATINFIPRNNRKLKFLYRKSIEFPQASQLQQTPDYSDPLNIKRGNPMLKPITFHDLQFNYNSINISTLRTLTIATSGKFIINQIVNLSFFDSIGRQATKPVNLNGNYLLELNINNYLPFKKQHFGVNLNTKGSLKRSLSVVNGKESISNQTSLTQVISFRYTRKTYECAITGSINYNNLSYNNNKELKENYVSGGLSFANRLNLPYGINLNSNLIVAWTTGRMEGYNGSPLMLNASISKSIFNNRQGLIKIQGFDVLKQNISYNRIIQDNYIEDISTNVLERFFTIGFSYFLGKNK